MSSGEILTIIASILVWAPVASIMAQLVRRAGWPPWANFVVVTFICYGAGIANSWIAGDLLGLIQSFGDLTAAQVITYGAAVHVFAVGYYLAYFKGLPFFGKLLQL